MKIFGFEFGKGRQPSTRKIYSRGRYQIVDGNSQLMIAPSSADNRGEDEILDPSKRAKLLDLTRNLVRNSSLFNTILGQLTTNVVSVDGGKAVFSFEDEVLSKTLKRNFFVYTRNTDFFTGDSLNFLLKRILREYVIGGDVVLVFDDGLVEDSGKILLFESDEIVDVPQAEIERRYGKGSTIRQGKVYSPTGRHIGTVVSKSQRGQSQVDPSKCYYLRKNPDSSTLENGWIQYSSAWREGRGVSQAASAIATIHQLEDLVQSELMAARRNSQIFCWLQQQTKDEENLPSAFDTSIDIDGMTDAEIEAAARAEAEEVKTVAFNHARENSVVYEALPEGFTANQLDMTHPNTNVQLMVDWLANRCAASMGLSKVYATGCPEDSSWRANQLFAYPAILELQKDLEKILDWAFARYVCWLQRKGIVGEMPEDYMRFVSWSWKGIDDLDEEAKQKGIRMALENCTASYREILGMDWQEKLRQIAYEQKWFNENGLLHPHHKLISGGYFEGEKGKAETNE